MRTVNELVEEYIRLSDVFDPWDFAEYISTTNFREVFTEMVATGDTQRLIHELGEFLEMTDEADEEYGNVVQLIEELKERKERHESHHK